MTRQSPATTSVSQIPPELSYNNAAIPKAAIPTMPPANIPGIAVGAAAPGLDEEEATEPPVGLAVLWPPVSVTPFETVMSLLDGFACVEPVIFGKVEERNPEVVAGEDEAAGAELAPAGAELCARDGIAIAARMAMMLRRMMMAVGMNAIWQVSYEKDNVQS
jgi:hypothetical protein